MNDLQKLARDLYALAVQRESKIVRHTLRGGLRLALQRTPGYWSLGAWRRGVVPGETEMKTLRRDFAVPKDAQVTGPLEVTPPGDTAWRGLALLWGGPREPLAEPACLVES
jgi:hypothetical protein